MRKKLMIIPLLLVFAASIIMLLYSIKMVKAKEHLELPSQKIIEIKNEKNIPVEVDLSNEMNVTNDSNDLNPSNIEKIVENVVSKPIEESPVVEPETKEIKNESEQSETLVKEEQANDVTEEEDGTSEGTVDTNEIADEEEEPERPVLVLESDTVIINAGEGFDVVSAVKEIRDDKMSNEEMFRRIRVVGDYNEYEPGEYTLEYMVTDDDGFDSKPKLLKLIVK